MRNYILLIISLLAPNFLQAQDLIPYRQHDLWGYANAAGELVIEPKFDGAERFTKHGLAIIEKAGKQGIIDENGKYILVPKYQKVRIVSPNLVLYAENRNATLVSRTGQVILQGAKLRYKQKGDYPNIAFQDQDKNLWTLLDSLGNVLMPMKYSTINPLPNNNNIAIVSQKEIINSDVRL